MLRTLERPITKYIDTIDLKRETALRGLLAVGRLSWAATVLFNAHDKDGSGLVKAEAEGTGAAGRGHDAADTVQN